MKIQKYQWGNPVEEWGSQWRERLQPSGGSKVIQKWNATGKKPKPESSTEKARKQAQPQKTWRSDVADIFHNIGEGVLALSPYTAVPYYGAKVGQDFLNGNVGVHTALNTTIAASPYSKPIQMFNSSKNLLSNIKWFIKNPQSTKVYHVNREGKYFPLQLAKTASHNNIGIHVTPKKEIAQSFNRKAPVIEAYIPKHSMETIDIGANDYRLISNDVKFGARPSGSTSFYDAAGNPKLFYKLLQEKGAIPSYEFNPEFTQADKIIHTEKNVSIPLRDKTWKNITNKANKEAEQILSDANFSGLKTKEEIENKAIQLNQKANDLLSRNNKKIIKYINTNPSEGGGGISYIVTDPKIFFNPKPFNNKDIFSLLKFPIISYANNK